MVAILCIYRHSNDTVCKKDIKKDWYIINAQNAAVGRLAAFISKVWGKNKPTFNPHMIMEIL